jgi:hypothetical protein
MTAPNSMKRAAVIQLMRKGLVTHDEAADLASTSRELVQHWAVREGIDIATTRATYLLKIWRSQLAEERTKQWTEQELTTEQKRLDQAWERHLMPWSPSSERMTNDGNDVSGSRPKASKINK